MIETRQQIKEISGGLIASEAAACRAQALKGLAAYPDRSHSTAKRTGPQR